MGMASVTSVTSVSLVSRSILLGPWGWPPFTYVFSSDFLASYSQGTNVFGPVTTVILVFRIGQLLRYTPFTRRQTYGYYGLCAVICLSMSITLIQVSATISVTVSVTVYVTISVTVDVTVYVTADVIVGVTVYVTVDVTVKVTVDVTM